LKYLLLFLVLFGPLWAANATFSVHFEHTNGVQPKVEYVVEEKQGPLWVEIAHGPTSPIVYTISRAFATYSIRMFVRTPGLPRDIPLDTSPVLVFDYRPGPPRKLSIDLTKSQ
jgi:hypothetical protein